MIDRLRTLAQTLTPIKPWAKAGGWLASAFLAWLLMFTSSTLQDQYLLPGIMVWIWSLMLWHVVVTFPHVPARAELSAGRWQKIKTAAKRAYFYLLALVTLAMTGGVMVLSIRWLAL